MFPCKRLLLLGCFLLAALMVSGGCRNDGGKKENGTKDESKKDDSKKGLSTEKDGWLYHTEGTEEYHLRLKVDPANKQARASIRDSDPNKVKPVSAKSFKLYLDPRQKPILLEAQPAKEDPKGMCSVFIGKDDRLAGKIDRKQVKLTTEIDGKPYTFKFDTGH